MFIVLHVTMKKDLNMSRVVSSPLIIIVSKSNDITFSFYLIMHQTRLG
jgi:hypothetical protein